MNRWKPEFGDVYYYVDNSCSVDIERYDGHTWDDERIAAGNCFNTKDDAHAAAEKVKALLLSLHSEPVADCNQFPKLTAEVFDRPDCPKWAKYAALGGGGMLSFYEDKPRMSKDEYPKRWINYDRWYPVEGVKFDASDWQNSLVERPAKALPDWCKVGEWVYLCNCTYSRIVSINDCHVNLENGISVGKNSIHEEMVSARLRPYNAEEMKALVGKVLTCNSRSTPCSFLVVYAEGDGSFIESYRFRYTAKELKDYFTIDGKPCGVLEHLEDGEWVK